jgi:hypothetical protein
MLVRFRPRQRGWRVGHCRGSRRVRIGCQSTPHEGCNVTQSSRWRRRCLGWHVLADRMRRYRHEMRDRAGFHRFLSTIMRGSIPARSCRADVAGGVSSRVAATPAEPRPSLRAAAASEQLPPFLTARRPRRTVRRCQAHLKLDHLAARVGQFLQGEAEAVPEKPDPLTAGPGDQFFGTPLLFAGVRVVHDSSVPFRSGGTGSVPAGATMARSGAWRLGDPPGAVQPWRDGAGFGDQRVDDAAEAAAAASGALPCR